MELTTLQCYLVCEAILAGLVGWSIVGHVAGEIYGRDFLGAVSAFVMFVGSLCMGALIIGIGTTLPGEARYSTALYALSMVIGAAVGLGIFAGAHTLANALLKKHKEASEESVRLHWKRKELEEKEKRLAEREKNPWDL